MPDVMPSTKTVEKRFEHQGAPYWNHNFHNPEYRSMPPGVREGHSSFLVGMQQPKDVLRAHFHLVDQFQVIVGGGGKIGNHEVHAGSLHYADACNAYGPLVAGPHGLWYFTLRARSDSTDSHFMPESRDELKGRTPGRDIVSEYYVNQGETLFRKDCVLETLLAPHPDGLAMYILRAGPGVKAVGPIPNGSGGQLCLVVNGTARHGATVMPVLSLAWVGPSEGPLELTAGISGMDVMVMQYPKPRPIEQVMMAGAKNTGGMDS